MEAFLEKARKLNREWNDLPRRTLVVLATCLALFVATLAFRLFAPFVCAFVFSWVIRPIARPLNYVFTRIKIPKSVGTLLAVVIVFGLILTVLVLLGTAIVGETQDLLESLPKFIEDVTAYIKDFTEASKVRISDDIGEEALELITNILTDSLNKLGEMASTLAGTLVTFTWSAVTVLPEVILFVIFTIMESYYIITDSERLRGFVNKWLPAKVTRGYGKVKGVMLMGVRAQIITALAQMVVAMAVLMAGFLILDIDYAVMFAILISVLDALPVIGAGLIMIPMSAYYLIIGQYMPAIGVMVLYCIVLVIKRVLEPKLLGKQMRINQLMTMTAMYAGFRILGFIGLLVGPLMVLLFKVVLSDPSAPQVPVKGAPSIIHRRKP